MTDRSLVPRSTVDPDVDPGGEPFIEPVPADPDVDPGAEPYHDPDLPEPGVDPDVEPAPVPDPDDPGARRATILAVERPPQPDPEFRRSPEF